MLDTIAGDAIMTQTLGKVRPVSYTLDARARAALDDISARRFGAGKSATVRAAVSALSLLYADREASTVDELEGARAVVLYVADRIAQTCGEEASARYLEQAEQELAALDERLDEQARSLMSEEGES